MYIKTKPVIKALKIAGTQRLRPYIGIALITLRVKKNVPQNVTVAHNTSNTEGSIIFK